MKILVVDDEVLLVKGIKFNLESEGYSVDCCYDGEAAVAMARENAYDLIILDLMMPKKDGLQACQEIRSFSTVPVIMLTARSASADLLMGFESGADDYVTKPFDMSEVIARVHAVMRRTDADALVEKKLVFDKLTVNLDSYELIVDGKKVDTPPKEMELLFHLASSPNRVFTRNQLLDEVWGFDYFGDSRTVDVHIKRLREKLEGVSDKWCLKTVWGVGYKFEVTE